MHARQWEPTFPSVTSLKESVTNPISKVSGHKLAIIEYIQHRLLKAGIFFSSSSIYCLLPSLQDSTVVCKKKCSSPGECDKEKEQCCKECVSFMTPEETKVCKFGSRIFRVNALLLLPIQNSIRIHTIGDIPLQNT